MSFLSKIADFFSMFDPWRDSPSSSSSSSSSFFDDHFRSKSSSFDDNVQTSSSMFEDTFRGGGVNPATGLPMINSCNWSSSHDHWNSSLSHDSWSSSSFGSDSFSSRWND